MPYDLIIFDCDGTLVDTEYLNILAIMALLDDLDIGGYDVHYGLTHFSGHRFSNIIQMISRQTGAIFPDNAAKLYLQKVRDLSDKEAKKIDHVHDMVEMAKKYSDICVVSNGERSNVLSSLEHAGLRRLFNDDYIFTGLMATPKPAPDLFLLATSKKNICPTKVLVIEDSIAGVTGAIAANMEAWGFCGTHHTPVEHAQKLLNAGASTTYNTMMDMATGLEKIFLDKIQCA